MAGGGGCDDLGLSQQLSGFPFASINSDVAAPSDDWVAVAEGGWDWEVAATEREETGVAASEGGILRVMVDSFL